MERRLSRPSISVSSAEIDAPPLDRVGSEEFFNSYEPKGALGRGLSSVVRRCQHRETNVEYAVKIIDKTLDRALASAVRTEIETLECVNHEFIIKLHEWFETPVYFFLVFELASHGELFDQLTKAVRFSEMRSRVVMIQLLHALDHIHQMGIVHRDVKPENILLADGFRLRLSDFGFAVRVENDHSLRELCGTPGYMAPEVLKCSTFEDAPGYGKPVDLWACGVILYTMLAGFPPFWHRKQLIMLRLIMDGRYSFEAPEWHDIGDPAKDLIRRLLVVNPKRRLTVQQVLTHPFIVEEASRSKRRRMVLNRFVGAVDAIVAVQVLNRTLTTPGHQQQLTRAQSCESVDILAVAGDDDDASSTSLSAAAPSEDDGDENEEIPTVETAPAVPYEHALIRSAIDGVAFSVYGHWVKKGDQQNRAAMFENQAKHVALRVQSRMAMPCSTPLRLSPELHPRTALSPLPHI